MTDFEGAHVACVNNGRAPRGFWVKYAKHEGWPSFADAMQHYRSALHMRGGEALLAIDAAVDVSDDVMGELERFCRCGARLAVPATAAVRLGATHLASFFAERVNRVREFEERTVAAAAVALGAPRNALALPRNLLGGPMPFLRQLDRILANIDKWPHPKELPPPYEGQW